MRIRKPPGEWWKINYTHALCEGELMTSNRPNVTTMTDALNERAIWSSMLTSIKNPHETSEFAYHSSSVSPPVAGVLASDIPIPSTMAEAFELVWIDHWKVAAQHEYNTLIERNTWELTNLPDDRKAIRCKWVFTVKATPDGFVDTISR
jgi:hypothetical protein